MKYPVTPDGRYFVVRGRLWRTSNPDITDHDRQTLTKELMAARRVVGLAKRADDATAMKAARAAVDAAKVARGKCGPVWWTDGVSDYNRHLANNTPYSEWFDALT